MSNGPKGLLCAMGALNVEQHVGLHGSVGTQDVFMQAFRAAR